MCVAEAYARDELDQTRFRELLRAWRDGADWVALMTMLPISKANSNFVWCDTSYGRVACIGQNRVSLIKKGARGGWSWVVQHAKGHLNSPLDETYATEEEAKAAVKDAIRGLS
jgi:hypothetical protein